MAAVFELQSERERDWFSRAEHYERRRGRRSISRNVYYERHFVTRFGTIRQRIARTEAVGQFLRLNITGTVPQLSSGWTRVRA